MSELLRQRCRRGMLELDHWLTCFLETRYVTLGTEMQAVFARLLGQDDMVLFDWLTQASEPPGEFRSLVEAIQSTRHSIPRRPTNQTPGS